MEQTNSTAGYQGTIGAGKQGLNANQLKMIAIIAMTIDHIAWTFWPGYRTDVIPLSMHVIGRLTAPIMMYFIVEGYYHTKNLKKYLIRMFLFAVPSHFAYCFMFGKSFIPFQNSFLDQTSVMWAFAVGLLALSIANGNSNLKPWQRQVLVTLCIFLALPADWSSPAAGIIVYMGMHRNSFKQQMIWMMLWITLYSIVYVIFLSPLYGIIQMLIALSIPLLRVYNGKCGQWRGMKWFFYWYYPVHLAILGLIRLALHA